MENFRNKSISAKIIDQNMKIRTFQRFYKISALVQNDLWFWSVDFYKIKPIKHKTSDIWVMQAILNILNS